MPRLAIPLYGDHVAPRFIFADQVLICDRGPGRGAVPCRMPLLETSGPARLRRLAAMDVSLLLCAGFQRDLIHVAQGLGIEVVWGLAGSAAQLLDAHRAGHLDQCRLASLRHHEEV